MWSIRYEHRGWEFLVSNWAFSGRDLGIIFSSENAHRIPGQDFEAIADWVKENASDIIAINDAREYEFKEGYISTEMLVKIITSPLTDDEDKAQALKEIRYRDNPDSRPKPPSKNQKSPQPGYIYLLQSENGLYKIGRSKAVESRLKSLQREFPIKIELVHSFWANDYMDTEADLHSLFGDERVGGEWFELSPDQVIAFMEFEDEEITIF